MNVVIGGRLQSLFRGRPLTDLFHALLDGDVVYALGRNHRRSFETGPSPDRVAAAAAAAVVVMVAIEAFAWLDSGLEQRVEQQDGEHVL